MARTLRVRMALLAAGLMFGVMLLLGGFLYLSLRLELLRAVDSGLRLSADQLVSTVENENGSLRFARGDVAGAQLSSEDDLLRLVTLDGMTVDQRGQPHLPLLPASLAGEGGTFTVTEDDGQAEQQNGEGDGQHDSGGSYRLISVPVPLSGQTAAYLQVARSMEPIDEALNALLVLLLFSGPIVMLLALAGGYWLAGRTLAPIERLRQEAAAISASTVEQRESLSNHLPDDEVGRLARTFDDMLTRLATSFQRQRRFTADASHELRTPLSILRGEVDVALEKPRSPAIYVETLHSIQAEVERMSRLVSDLLVLSRRDNDQLVLQKASVDISELLRNLTAQVSEQNEAEGMSFTSDLPARLLLCADLDRLIQLFLNLLDNVMAHAPGSQVSITASGSGNWVHVQVADTGPGIPPEHLPHIFERFYRVDPARSRARGGSGLGLAIAKEIALAHGGDIDVSSPAGGGTVFVVNLPLAADECSPQGREIQG